MLRTSSGSLREVSGTVGFSGRTPVSSRSPAPRRTRLNVVAAEHTLPDQQPSPSLRRSNSGVVRSVATATLDAPAARPRDKWALRELEYQMLFEEIEDEEHFRRVVSAKRGDSPDLIFIEYYGQWCGPCRLIIPELMKVASHEETSSRCRFYKVNVENMRELALKEGVKSMPYVGLYKPGEGQVAAFASGPTRTRNLRRNIWTVLLHEGNKFRTDLSGNVVPVLAQAQ